MRGARPLLALSACAGIALILSPGCQDPTQVTVDIRLATARCDEIHGTAITVGVDPADTEERIRSRFPTGQTTDCDPATSRIGTLVVTPSDEDRASVVVVAAYGVEHDPTACQPPSYANCVVARRRFSFAKHRRLTLPITIDPTCVNVPCDAFSTCRRGACFSSEIDPCEGDACSDGEPGSLPDGGTDLDAAVPSDGGPITSQASCSGPLLRSSGGCGAPRSGGSPPTRRCPSTRPPCDPSRRRCWG
jgi:hypothetical protein